MSNKLLEGLNKEQIEAVTTTEGYVRVIAGAGSGKTRALTTRYAYLVDSLDISPNRILSVTFTNKAANEMKERIIQLVGDVATPYIMTFHAFCNRFLHSEIDVLDISPKFKIMDIEDQTDILKVVYNELGLTNKDIAYKKALSEIIGAGCKNGQRTLLSNYEELIEKYSSYELNKLMELSDKIELKIIYGYLREQKRDACLDYEDLLNFTLHILKTRKDVREVWETNFDYIQVDEFQDVSLREVELVGILSKECGNLFVVGDDSQCLVEGTKIRTDIGFKNIEDIKVDDIVLAGVGQSDVLPCKVESISKKYIEEEIVVIKTKTGSILKGTKNHMGFTIIPNNMGSHYVYLMYKKEIGFRIGISSGYTVKKGKQKAGFEGRLTQESGDVLWVLKIVNTLKEAIFWEQYYSYKYGIPQYVFRPRNQRENSLSFCDIQELHRLLKTKENGERLLEEIGMSKEFPHRVPQASGYTDRYKLNFVMFGSNRKYSWGVYPNELSASTGDEKYTNILEKYFTVCKKRPKTENRRAYNNARLVTWDYDRQFDILNHVVRDCENEGLYITTQKSAKFTENKFDFTPFSNMLVGMLIPIYKDGIIIEDTIVEITKEKYIGYVYDINVPNVRNFIAEDIVVHNCIYSFRGADVNCIVHFEEIMGKVHGKEVKAKSIYLTTNYRSTPEILNVSNSLIKHNLNRVDKTLVANNKNGPKVLHYHARSIYTEADWVANRILSFDRPLSDFAILYRSNSSSRAIEEKLMENGIKYEVLSGISFYSRKEIKDVLAVLSLVAFGDNLAFMRTIKNLSLGIGPKKVTLLQELTGNKTTLYNALRANADIKTFKSTKAQWLVDLIEELRVYSEVETISMLMGRVFLALNLEEMYKNNSEIERWENLQELKKSAQHFEHNQREKVDLADYLGMLALFTSSDTEEDLNKVKLMTIHAAKGLEYPIVFVIGMNEGLMPSSRTNSAEMLEEERRIAYVAMTRAKEILFLSDAEGENFDRTYRLPSRFLFNIPRDLYNSEGKLDAYLVKQTQLKVEEDDRKLGRPTSNILDSITDRNTIKMDSRVRHSTFGEGTVMQVSEGVFVILFDNVGIKGIKSDSTKIELI